MVRNTRVNLSDKGTRFCLTVNTPDDDPDGHDALPKAIEDIRRLFDEGRFIYAIGSYERGGENNRLHLQCWAMAKFQMRVGYVTSQITNAWACVQSSRDDDKAALYACNPGKEGFIEKAFEFGERPSKGAGRRTDLETVNALIASNEVLTFRDVNDVNPGVVARYPNWVNWRIEEAARDEMLRHRRANPVFHADYVWQHWLRRYLTELPPDDRKIIFVRGKHGHDGKSSFARDFRDRSGMNCLILRPGRKADMAEALQPRIQVLFVDIVRGMSEYVAHLYSFLEECKDGEVFNPKYNSRMIPLPPCHVVVLMNGEVATGAGGYYPSTAPGERDLNVRGEAPLSHDRYAIWELGPDHLTTYRPDLERWGRDCPPFRSYDRNWTVVPYVPPLIVTSGPEFNGDMAGDGPDAPFLEFVPVLVVVVPGTDDELNGSTQYMRVERDVVIEEFGYDMRADDGDWLEYVDGQPDWFEDYWLYMVFPNPPVGGRYVFELTQAHVASLPDEISGRELDGFTVGDIIIQRVVFKASARDEFDCDEHAAAA